MAYLNGELSSDALDQVPWDTSKRVAKTILTSLAHMGDAFKQQFGHYPYVTSAYRTRASQQILFDKYGYPRANYPGKSNHGWGTALDFGSGINTYKSPEWRWMNTIGRTFGFRPLNENNLTFEPWHWACLVPVAFGSDGTTETEDNMTAQFEIDVRAEMKWLRALLTKLDADLRAELKWQRGELGELESFRRDVRDDLVIKEEELDDINGIVMHLIPNLISALPVTAGALTTEQLQKIVEDSLRNIFGSLKGSPANG